MRLFLKISVVILIFTFSTTKLYSDKLGTLKKIEGTYVPINNNQIIGADIAKLFFTDEYGKIMPSNESYICIYLQNNYPVISATIYGHTVSLKVCDIDGDDKQELLAFYHAGGNQYALNLFEISENKLLPFKHQPVSSNMRSIEISKGKISVKNVDINGESRKIITDHYKIINGDCILDSSTTTVPSDLKGKK